MHDLAGHKAIATNLIMTHLCGLKAANSADIRLRTCVDLAVLTCKPCGATLVLREDG